MNNIIKYIKDSWIELKKVVWPSRRDTYRNTLLVIAVSVAIALFLGLSDYGLNLGLEQLISIKSIINKAPAGDDGGKAVDIQETNLQETPEINITPESVQVETQEGDSSEIKLNEPSAE